jgi:hypothetical protein
MGVKLDVNAYLCFDVIVDVSTDASEWVSTFQTTTKSQLQYWNMGSSRLFWKDTVRPVYGYTTKDKTALNTFKLNVQ